MPSIYVPYMLMLSDALNVILRTSHDPLSITRSIREAVCTVDPNQPVNRVRTAEDALASAGWAREPFRGVAVARLRGVCADTRSSRLYSVVLYSVSCRFKIWIRMSLVPSRAHRRRCSPAAVLAIVAGLFAGLALSVGLNRLSLGGRSPIERSGRVRRREPGAVCRDDDVRRGSSEPSSSIQPADALRTD